MEVEIGITCVLLVALVFLSTIDMAFGELSDVGLRRLLAEAESRNSQRAAEFLEKILESRTRFRFTLTAAIQILLVAVSILATSITLRLVVRFGEFSHALFLAAALAVGLALGGVFRQLIPRLLTLRRPDDTLLATLPALQPFYGALELLALPLDRLVERKRIERQTSDGGDAETDAAGAATTNVAATTATEDIQALLDVGEEEGIIEEEQGELIHSIIEFGDTRVSEVMTPRTEIVAVPVTASVREVRDVMVESKYSRLPVYREQIDDIAGLIYVRDLLQCWSEGREDERIETLLRPTYFVPETKHIADLLEEMQKAHTQLAMVIDEYGGVAGLVTVEDILEEIVGEIEDEDIERDEIVEIVEAGDGYYDVPGSIEVGKIERLFGIEIEDDDFTTVAGLVIREAGTVPKPGAHLNVRGIDVEVLDSDERKINRLRLRRAPQMSEAQAE